MARTRPPKPKPDKLEAFPSCGIASSLSNKDCLHTTPFDVFSFGHIMMGQFTTMIVMIIETVLNIFLGVWFILVALVVGVGWEGIENGLLYKIGMKFGRRDSLLNVVFDIVAVVLGALVSLFLPPSILIVTICGWIIVVFVACLGKVRENGGKEE